MGSQKPPRVELVDSFCPFLGLDVLILPSALGLDRTWKEGTETWDTGFAQKGPREGLVLTVSPAALDVPLPSTRAQAGPQAYIHPGGTATAVHVFRHALWPLHTGQWLGTLPSTRGHISMDFQTHTRRTQAEGAPQTDPSSHPLATGAHVHTGHSM